MSGRARTNAVDDGVLIVDMVQNVPMDEPDDDAGRIGDRETGVSGGRQSLFDGSNRRSMTVDGDRHRVDLGQRHGNIADHPVTDG